MKRPARLLKGLVRLLTFGHYRRNMNAWTDLVLAQSILQPLTYESSRFDDDRRDRYIAEAAYYIDSAMRKLYGEMYTGGR